MRRIECSHRMRRTSACLAVLGLAAFVLPALAAATPRGHAGWPRRSRSRLPGTGNILGAGAAVEAKYTIHGTESTGGVVSQLTHVNFYLPTGTKLHPQGFVTCAPTTLENIGPSGCPKKSQASPVGSAGVVDPIGGELVKENATLQAFFAPGGGLQFYVNAASPISAQLVVSKGSFVRHEGSVWIEAERRSAADPVGAGRAGGIDRIDQHQGRSGVQEGQEDDLLRHAAEQMPEGRFPGQVGTDVRERRNRIGVIQGTVPCQQEEEVAYPPGRHPRPWQPPLPRPCRAESAKTTGRGRPRAGAHAAG